MIETSQEIGELAKALAKAQGEFKDAVADSKNPHFDSFYAGLDSVRHATIDALYINGISFMQHPVTSDGKLCLTTMLLHTSGQFLKSTFQLNVEKPTMQGLKSAVTYARRIAWLSILGLAEADDDGNEAENHPVLGSSDQSPIGEYAIEMGFNKGRKLNSFHPDELIRLVNDAEEWAKTKSAAGKPTGKMKIFIDMANKYLAELADTRP
jgi:hypothetical protein